MSILKEAATHTSEHTLLQESEPHVVIDRHTEGGSTYCLHGHYDGVICGAQSLH